MILLRGLRAFTLTLAILLLLAKGSDRASAQSDVPAAPVHHGMTLVVVLLPGTTLDDWRDKSGPDLRYLMDSGAMALMNTRTARMATDHVREPTDAAVLTLGAGARAASTEGAGSFVDWWTIRAKHLKPPADPRHVNDWFDPTWSHERHASFGLEYDIELGNLQESLWKVHHPMVVERIVPVGAASPMPATDPTIASGTLDPDESTLPNGGFGCGLLFAADSHGGALAGGVLPNPQQTEPGDCWVLDLGPDLTAADAGIGQATQFARELGGRLMIISPYANDDAYAQDDRLTPVLLWGDGVSHGLLTSATTHRNGVIANIDIAPTIASYYGATLQTQAFGAPITVRPQVAGSPDAVDSLVELHDVTLAQRHGQVVLPYCALFIGLCLLIQGLAVLRGIHSEGRLAPVWLLICAALPVGVIVSLKSTGSLEQFETVLVLPVLGLFGLGIIRRQLPFAMVIMVAVLAAGIPIVTAAGIGRIDSSLLGYSPIEGARYYGIGNETMGVLLGAALASFAAGWEHLQRWRTTLLVLMAAMVFIIGFPTMGAKAGGVIVLVGAFGVYFRSASGRPFDTGAAIVSALVGIVVLMAFAVSDAHHASGSQSHMGSTIHRITTGGLPAVWHIIARKLAVELKLVTRSTWAVPVWAGLFCLTMQRRQTALTPATRALSDAGLVGSILALLFNDAGAVACALCLAIVCGSITCANSLQESIAQVAKDEYAIVTDPVPSPP